MGYCVTKICSTVHAIIIPPMIIKQLVAISMVMTQAAAGILWFSKGHKDQEDPLLLAASLDYEK